MNLDDIRSRLASAQGRTYWRSLEELSDAPAFREYIARERVPNYTIPDRVVVGGILPETGITTYDVPQTYGVTPYRYTVVNGQTVLVEPRTRRIVQVLE